MSDIRNYFNIPIDTNKSETVKSKSSTNLNIYTDGSSLNNGQKGKYHSGGIGIYIEDSGEEISIKLDGTITNNIAELKACIVGINTILSRKTYSNEVINIYSDSEYVIKSITQWSINWKKNDWKKYNKIKKCKTDIKNKELIIELYTLYINCNINFIHVKAHTSKPLNNKSKEYKIWYGNYIADKLAVSASCNN